LQTFTVYMLKYSNMPKSAIKSQRSIWTRIFLR